MGPGLAAPALYGAEVRHFICKDLECVFLPRGLGTLPGVVLGQIQYPSPFPIVCCRSALFSGSYSTVTGFNLLS